MMRRVICDYCKKPYETETSIEEMASEAEPNGFAVDEPMGEVCDDCYITLMAEIQPRSDALIQ